MDTAGHTRREDNEAQTLPEAAPVGKTANTSRPRSTPATTCSCSGFIAAYPMAQVLRGLGSNALNFTVMPVQVTRYRTRPQTLLAFHGQLRILLQSDWSATIVAEVSGSNNDRCRNEKVNMVPHLLAGWGD